AVLGFLVGLGGDHRMTAVAFLGICTIGYPIAGHLRREGHDVCVYNRTQSKASLCVEEYA
ncbi:NAD(P)-binding domain-containing protein, partial [Pseudomonas paraeruginosa]|uniref:NAD(P)-binding domain-containing protein n=1 Tax=Pseudomonas paraeruginosa TaxID=2994495 RepID=UPI003A4C6998